MAQINPGKGSYFPFSAAVPRGLIFLLILLVTHAGFSSNLFLAITNNDTIITPTVLPVVADTLYPVVSGDTLQPMQDTLLFMEQEPSDTLLAPSAQSDTIEPSVPVRRPIRIPQPGIEDEDLPVTAVKWFTEQQLQNPFSLIPNFIDTTLIAFQTYDFAAADHTLIATMGNIGHAHRRLIFEPDMSGAINFGEQDIFGSYLFRHENLRFYRPRHVFTDLFYMIGDEREQVFYGKHKQKLYDNFHGGFQYRINNSPGAFSRSNARSTNLYLTLDFLSPDHRYQALGSFIYNRMRRMESGGLSDHTVFEENPDSDFVILDRAEAWYRDLSVNLRHFYQTGFYTQPDEDNEIRFINLGRINHHFTYSRKAFLMDDQSTPFAFYDFPRLDSVNTFDSTVVHRIENLISWSNSPLSGGRFSFPFNFRLYLKHSIHSIQQPDFRPPDEPATNEEGERIYYATRENFYQLVQGAEIESDRRRLLSFGGYTNVTLGGYQDEDFQAGGFLNIGRPERDLNLQIMLRYSLIEAPFFLNRISVNNIRWDNDFEKQQIINLRAVLTLPWVSLAGNYYLLDRMVYLGRDAMPVQNTAELGFFSLEAKSKIELGRVGFRNHIALQQTTSDNYHRFPTLASYHSLFINFGLSDNNLINQLGIDFHFNTPYKAMAYMPVVRSFYLQDEHELRAKHLVDVFWNAKVSRARLFIKYQNILGLLFDVAPHYDIPFYPHPESAFKFGVSWMFFD